MTSDTKNSITARAVRSHLEAIASPLFDIGIFDPAAHEGDGEMLLRTWTGTEVLNSLDWLRFKNAQRFAIYVRPHGEHAYTLVDDLKAESLSLLELEHQPSAIIETSPGNFQAWLYHGDTLPAALGTRVASILAERFAGDPGAAAWRQFGRLAGFTNNKPAYRQANGLQPYVRLKHAKRCIYAAQEKLLAEARGQLEQEQQMRVRYGITRIPQTLKNIEAFYADPRYGGDLHRADLAYATYALARGATEEQISEAIAQRDLTHKGSVARQSAYITRTIRKAASVVSFS